MQQRDEERARQFSDLVSAHQTALLRLCHTLLRDRSLAEDAVQDTFLRVWQHMDQLREVSNPRAWIYRIAVNRCRDLRRSAWLRHIAGQIPESQPDPSAGIPVDALSLNLLIQRLPFRQREVILLYYYQNFTVQEIADILHLSHSAVSERLKRGLSGLAAGLKGSLEGGPDDE